jgi:hypothetical protein
MTRVPTRGTVIPEVCEDWAARWGRPYPTT